MTRDVASDLWFLKQLGEASTDSQALLDSYLFENDSFAATLRESERLNQAMPYFRMSSDAELRILEDARKRAKTKLLIIGAAVGLAGLALLAALGTLILMMFYSA